MKAIISVTVNFKLKHWYFQCRNREMEMESVFIGHVLFKPGFNDLLAL